MCNSGAEVIESFRFPDHHEYTLEEIQDAMDQAIREGAEAIATTEKDAVKLPHLPEREGNLPIYVITVEVVMQDEGKQIDQLLKQRIDDFFRRSEQK